LLSPYIVVGDFDDSEVLTGAPFFVTETLAPAKLTVVDCTDHDVSWVAVVQLLTLSRSGYGKYPADGQGIISTGLVGFFPRVPMAYSDSLVFVEPEPIWVVSGSSTH